MTRPFNSRIRFNAIKSTLFASHCGHKRQVRGGLLRVLYPISRYAKPYAKVYRSWLFDTVVGRKCFSAIRRDVRGGLREGENRFVGGWINNWLEKFIIIRRASACCRIKRFSRNHDLFILSLVPPSSSFLPFRCDSSRVQQPSSSIDRTFNTFANTSRCLSNIFPYTLYRRNRSVNITRWDVFIFPNIT